MVSWALCFSSFSQLFVPSRVWSADLFAIANAWTTENYMPVQVVYELVQN